jgi:hypothetical protein
MHEFVRSEEIDLMPNRIQGPWVQRVGFGGVVLLRTCWSSDSSASMECYGGGIVQGIWAGHQFDITTADEVISENWKDVSGRPLRKLGRLGE